MSPREIPCPGVWTGERRRGSAPSVRLPSGRRELGTWISPHCEPLHVPIPTRRSPDRRSATPHRGGRRGRLLGAVESPHRAITCSDRVMGACFWPHIVAQGQKEWISQTGMSLLKAEGSSTPRLVASADTRIKARRRRERKVQLATVVHQIPDTGTAGSCSVTKLKGGGWILRRRRIVPTEFAPGLVANFCCSYP